MIMNLQFIREHVRLFSAGQRSKAPTKSKEFHCGSSQLKPTRDWAESEAKAAGIVWSIVEIKEGVQVSGRKMDELIMALTRRGRGAWMPLHHPALTAAGQLWCHNRAEGLCPWQLGTFQPFRAWQSCQVQIEVLQQQLSNYHSPPQHICHT